MNRLNSFFKEKELLDKLDVVLNTDNNEAFKALSKEVIDEVTSSPKGLFTVLEGFEQFFEDLSMEELLSGIEFPIVGRSLFLLRTKRSEVLYEYFRSLFTTYGNWPKEFFLENASEGDFDAVLVLAVCTWFEHAVD